MPTAALLSGFAVPTLALTIGWRWAYVLGGAVAIVAFAYVRRVTTPIGRIERGAPVTLRSSHRALSIAATAGLFMAFGAGALNAWVVSSGVESGMSEGVAGLMLSLGAGCGIAMRLFFGFRIDGSRTRPFRWAGSLSMVGAVGIAALAVGGSSVHIVATLVAFGTGWVWPVFTNFGIVRANAAAAATATGLTQMGVYIGVFTAPLVTGRIIESSGYATMWVIVAATMVAGAGLAFVVADEF